MMPAFTTLPWYCFIAIAPAIALLCYLYEQDRHQHKSYGARLRVFLLGSTMVIPAFLIESWFDRVIAGGRLSIALERIPTGAVEFTPLVDAFLMGFVWSGAVEELIKIYYLSWIKHLKVFNSRHATIAYTLVLGLAFATIENIFYVLSFFHESHDIAYGRAFISLPMHAACAVLMGYFVGEAEFTPGANKPLLYFRAWAIATIIHGSFNTLLFMGLPFSGMFALLVMLVSLGVAIVLWHQVAQASQPVVAQPLHGQSPAKHINQATVAEQSKLATHISTLMNRSLQPKGITATATCIGDRLQVQLTAAKPLPQSAAEWVHRGVTKLNPQNVRQLEVVGKQSGVDQPCWHQKFSLPFSQTSPVPQIPVTPPAKLVKVASQPQQKITAHRGFSLMAVLAGFLADTLLTQLLSVSLFFGAGLFSNSSTETLDATFQSFSVALLWLGLALLCTALGGMLTVHLSRLYPLRHTLAMGGLSTIAGFFSYSIDSPFPLWLDAIALLLPLPTAVLGGYLYWYVKGMMLRGSRQKALAS